MVLLDTHAWIWWVDAPERLSVAARKAIEDAGAIGVSAISCWELAMLVAKRRIAVDLPVAAWARQALSQPGIVALPLSPQQGVEAGLLGDEFPGDPADRLIYATARDRGAALVTRDERLREYDPRGTVW